MTRPGVSSDQRHAPAGVRVCLIKPYDCFIMPVDQELGVVMSFWNFTRKKYLIKPAFQWCVMVR